MTSPPGRCRSRSQYLLVLCKMWPHMTVLVYQSQSSGMERRFLLRRVRDARVARWFERCSVVRCPSCERTPSLVTFLI
jgi:hypothetical protein